MSPELPKNLLRWFESDYGGQHLPKGTNGLPNPNHLTPDDVWGGIIRLEIPEFPKEHWTVVYRILNGGNSEHNGSIRPQRYLIITAWIQTSETEGVNLLPILTSPMFQTIAEKAEQHPVPTPAKLLETRVLPTIGHSFSEQIKPIATVIQKELKTVSFVQSVAKISPLPKIEKEFTDCDNAINYFANIPFHRIVLLPIQPFVWLKIECIGSRQRGTIQIGHQIESQIEPNLKIPSKHYIESFPPTQPPSCKKNFFTKIREFFNKLLFYGAIYLSGLITPVLLWLVWNLYQLLQELLQYWF
jgi:hypothetical protein